MNYDETLAYFVSLGHETLNIRLGLTNTELLLGTVGNPHRQFPSVQIVGTNGKGSIARTIESICGAAGIRCGLFISPHLVSITERIRLNGKQICESDFARLTTVVKENAAELLRAGKLQALPTVFEHVTVIALLAFREAQVDLAFIEAGMGGRRDSTTAAGATIVAIASITLDHEEYLGRTVAEIAAEKSAIIHSGVTAIIAPQMEEALEVILSQCETSQVDARFVRFGEEGSLSRQHHSRSGPDLIPTDAAETVDTSDDGRLCVRFTTSLDDYGSLWLGLRGRHQIANTLTAIALAEALRERGFAITREAIARGVETVTHPGRLELWEGQPQILFDGAHNPAAAAALREYLDEFVKQPITMIFGAMGDKALPEMAATLFPNADELILTKLDNPRAASLDMLMAAVPKDFNNERVQHASSVSEALRLAREVTPTNGLICVTGSLYLVGAVQQALKESVGVAHGRD
jgi:dihydrofolate synthase/folylpolyglutamate synthase